MTLKMTSAWFRAMFTRTGPSRGTAKSETPPPPPPFPSTLEALSRCMTCSLEIITLDTWDTVDLVLYAAEKYDLPSPALDRVGALAHADACRRAPAALGEASKEIGNTDEIR